MTELGPEWDEFPLADYKVNAERIVQARTGERHPWLDQEQVDRWLATDLRILKEMVEGFYARCERMREIPVVLPEVTGGWWRATVAKPCGHSEQKCPKTGYHKKKRDEAGYHQVRLWHSGSWQIA